MSRLHGIRAVALHRVGVSGPLDLTDLVDGHFYNRSVTGDEFLDASGQHYHVGLEAELSIVIADRAIASTIADWMRNRSRVIGSATLEQSPHIVWTIHTVPHIVPEPIQSRRGGRVTWRITLHSTGHSASQITPLT